MNLKQTVMKHALCILLLCGSIGNAMAQNAKLKGTVINETGEPIIGVTVEIKNVTGAVKQTTATNEKGIFTFSNLNVATKYNISFSSVGYERYEQKSIELSATEEKSILIRLRQTSTTLNDVVVGSRSSNRNIVNSTVPIDVLSIKNVQTKLPQNDLNQLLTNLIPSFQSNRQSNTDGSEHIDPAQIRGLGADELLVLINGKRRHTSSLLNYYTVAKGTVGTDMNAIPISAIEKIEVLRDGASAQYGSDAIAGVINVILKKNTNVFDVNFNSGIYKAGDGAMNQLSGNYGTSIGKKGGFINLTADLMVRGGTNRTNNPDFIIFDQAPIGNSEAGNDPWIYDWTNDSKQSRAYDDSILRKKGLSRDDFNFTTGDAKLKQGNVFLNLSIPLNSSGTEFYTFGGYNYRNGTGSGDRRLPYTLSANVYDVMPTIFSNGYQPHVQSTIQDRSLTVGLKHHFGSWNADISNTYGNNRFDYDVTNTLNPSMLAFITDPSKMPTSFYAGATVFSQNTTNLDFTHFHKFSNNSINISLGSEFRVDQYKILAGEEASWKDYNYTGANGVKKSGGSQSFFGFTPTNATNKSRNNFSLYGEADLNVNKIFVIESAIRFENYSDFGSTINGKLSSRVTVNPWINLRASLSTGFRAPSLHQQYFSYSFTAIGNVGLQVAGIFPSTSAVASGLGIDPLKQETSANYSAGFTLQPTKELQILVDGYLIDIKNRIILTGTFNNSTVLAPYGVKQARFFNNALNTQTKGLDVVINYSKAISASQKIDIALAGNLNDNSITNVTIPTKWLAKPTQFFSPSDSTVYTKGLPNFKSSLSITYNYKKATFYYHNTYFGSSQRNGWPYGVLQEYAPKISTDISLGYSFSKNVSLTIGANNILNVYPDEQAYGNSYYGVFKYAPVQMGFNGAYYFGRLNIKINNKK